MSTPKKRKLLETTALPAVTPRATEPTGRAAIDQNYFKIYAPHEIKRELKIEAMDARKRTARYCLEILEERLPYDVRLALQAKAEREGRSVQAIILESLATTGLAEAAAHISETKKKR